MAAVSFNSVNGGLCAIRGKNFISPMNAMNFCRFRYFRKWFQVLSISKCVHSVDISRHLFTVPKITKQCAVYETNMCKCWSNNTLLSPKNIVMANFSHFSSVNKSRFTLENADFASYVRSLEEEYGNVQSRMNGDDKRQLNDKTYRRMQFLKPVVEFSQNLNEKYEELRELLDLCKDEEDVELKSLAEKDVVELRSLIQEMEEQMADVLVGEEIADSSDVILEVSAGVGGQEAMLFASELFSMYVNYARYKNWSVTGLTQEEDSLGGSRKANVQIAGADVYRYLKHEVGVHRVQRVPKTERQGRMHTSTATVSVLPQPKEIDIEISTKDLKIETMRGSGPGGQSVNTTDSAVRITHLPSGAVVECREERSQIQNKAKAMEKLKTRMYQEKLDEMEKERRSTLKMQVGSRDRSEKVRTYNFRDDRVSDHRVKGNVSNILGFMYGQERLDELIEDLEIVSRSKMLESMLDQYVIETNKSK